LKPSPSTPFFSIPSINTLSPALNGASLKPSVGVTNITVYPVSLAGVEESTEEIVIPLVLFVVFNVTVESGSP